MSALKSRVTRRRHAWKVSATFALRNDAEAAAAHDPTHRGEVELNTENLEEMFVYCDRCEQTWGEAHNTRCPGQPVTEIGVQA